MSALNRHPLSTPNIEPIRSYLVNCARKDVSYYYSQEVAYMLSISTEIGDLE